MILNRFCESVYLSIGSHEPMCVRACVWDMLCGSSAQQEIYAQFGGTFRGLMQKADPSLLPGPIPVSLEDGKT